MKNQFSHHDEPQFLRYVINELSKSIMDGKNISQIPQGVSGIYENLFPSESNVIARKNISRLFLLMALIPDGASIKQMSEIFEAPEEDIKNIIEQYSKFLNRDVYGNYMLYHSRLISYLLQRFSRRELVQMNLVILRYLSHHLKDDWALARYGHHLAIGSEIVLLFKHIQLHSSRVNESWWLRDLSNLIDQLLIRSSTLIDYTSLCQILKKVNDYSLINKGSYIIVIHAEKINWNNLEDFSDTSRFQYDLAFQFAINPDKLPLNWWSIVVDEGHQLSYTFSYAWKYLAIADKTSDFLIRANLSLQSCSPYQKIILVMIWGGRSLKHGFQNWFDSCRKNLFPWPYLYEEMSVWEQALIDQVNPDINKEFDILRSKLPEHLHYIFDHYWCLIEHYRMLTRDIAELNNLDCSFEVAYWLYKNPYWELGKIANSIILYKLREKRTRSDALQWIRDVWEREELYVMGELVFYIGRMPELKDEFLRYCISLCGASSAPLRGSFISDLVGYYQDQDDLEFRQFVLDSLVPKLIISATDIWETQEMIRLLNELKIDSTDDWFQHQVSHHFLLSKIPGALNMDFNLFWQTSEQVLGFDRQ